MKPSPEAEAWDELQRLAEKHRSLTDPDLAGAVEAMIVSKAQSLALSAKSKPGWVADFPLLAAILAGVRAENPTDPTSKSDASDPADLPKPSQAPAVPNDIELAERLIRDAHIASMRGDKAKAKDLLDEAERAAPTAGAVLVALGDAADERHNLKEALRLYTLAKEAEPNNVAIERKHAEAVFRQTQGFVFDPTARAGGPEAAASAKAATFMSALLPGLGQMVLGDTVKGAILMGGYLLSWAIAILIGFSGLVVLLGASAKVPGTEIEAKASPVVLLPLAFAAIFYLIAVNDAAARAKTAARKPIIRPVPPSDLPFE